MSDTRLDHLRNCLRDRYEFRDLIGRRPSASVYQVQNLRLKRQEALKVPSETRSKEWRGGLDPLADHAARQGAQPA